MKILPLCLALLMSWTAHAADSTETADVTLNPDDWAQDLVVEVPARAPASTKPQTKSAAKTSARRSQLPSSVADGFELKVRYNKETTVFWVVKRDSHHEVVYATSGGSRATVSLAPDVFERLHTTAQRLPAKEYDIRKCADASMQIHVVSAQKPEHTFTSCVNAKGRDAQSLREMSQSLAMIVK